MTIEFPCPHCARLVRTPDAVAGKKGKCPGCQGIVQIPAANGTSQPAVASPPTVKTPPPPAKPPVAANDTGPLEFFCSSCGQVVRTPRAAAGKKGKCPHCDEVISIPLIGNPAAAAKQAAASLKAPAPSTAASAATAAATGKEERKRLAIESVKESSKPQPAKALAAVPQAAKPTEAAPQAPALKGDARVVVPVAAEVAAAVQASKLAVKTAEYFGAADPFATLHQHAAPGLVIVTPAPGAVPQRAPAPLPPLVPQPAAALPPPTLQSAPMMSAPVKSTPTKSAPPVPAAAFEPLSPMKPLGPPPSAIALPASAPANPFSELSPAGSQFAPAAAGSPLQAVTTAVHIPAVVQLCLVIPCLLAYLLYFGGCVVYGCFAALGMLVQDTQLRAIASATLTNSVVYGLLTLVLMVVQGVVIFGSIRQLQRRSLLLVQISNCLALIPCVSPMGFPSAAWSLVCLYQDEVKRSFH